MVVVRRVPPEDVEDVVQETLLAIVRPEFDTCRVK